MRLTSWTILILTTVLGLAGLACNGEFLLNPEDINDTTPPVIQSLSPAAGATNQALNCSVIVEFDDLINGLTVGSNCFYMMKDGSSEQIPALYFLMAGQRSIRLQPTVELEAGTRYQVFLLTNIQNLKGYALEQATNWWFETGSWYDDSAYDPAVVFTSPQDGAYVKGIVTVAGTSTSISSTVVATELSINGGTWTSLDTLSWSYQWNTDSVPEGTNTVAVRSFNVGGTCSTNVQSVIVDRSVPAVTIAAPAAGSNLSGTVLLSGTAIDTWGLAKIEVQFGSLGWMLASGTENWSLSLDTTQVPEDTYTVSVRVTDKAGNETTETVANVTIDNWADEYTYTSARCWDFDMAVVDGQATPRILYGKGDYEVYWGEKSTQTLLDGTDYSALNCEIEKYGSTYHYAYYGTKRGSGDIYAKGLNYWRGGSYYLIQDDTDGSTDTPSLRLDPAGDAHIAYGYTQGGTTRLRYAYWNGSTMEKATSTSLFDENGSDSFGKACDVVVGSSYKRHFVYYNQTKGILRYRRLFHTGITLMHEQSVDIESVAVNDARIMVNGSTVYIAYSGSFGVKLAVSTDGGNSFSSSTVESGAVVGKLDMLVAPAVVLVYERSGGITVAKQGTGWTFWRIAAQSTRPRLAFSDGTLWVGYHNFSSDIVIHKKSGF